MTLLFPPFCLPALNASFASCVHSFVHFVSLPFNLAHPASLIPRDCLQYHLSPPGFSNIASCRLISQSLHCHFIFASATFSVWQSGERGQLVRICFPSETPMRVFVLCCNEHCYNSTLPPIRIRSTWPTPSPPFVAFFCLAQSPLPSHHLGSSRRSNPNPPISCFNIMLGAFF